MLNCHDMSLLQMLASMHVRVTPHGMTGAILVCRHVKAVLKEPHAHHFAFIPLALLQICDLVLVPLLALAATSLLSTAIPATATYKPESTIE